jgi:hypothetical protein
MRFVIFFLSVVVALIAAIYSVYCITSSKEDESQLEETGKETLSKSRSKRRKGRGHKSKNRSCGGGSEYSFRKRGGWGIWDLFSGYYIYATIKRICGREVRIPMCQTFPDR